MGFYIYTMFRKIFSIAIIVTAVACASMKPAGENALLVTGYMLDGELEPMKKARMYYTLNGEYSKDRFIISDKNGKYSFDPKVLLAKEESEHVDFSSEMSEACYSRIKVKYILKPPSYAVRAGKIEHDLFDNLNCWASVYNSAETSDERNTVGQYFGQDGDTSMVLNIKNDMMHFILIKRDPYANTVNYRGSWGVKGDTLELYPLYMEDLQLGTERNFNSKLQFVLGRKDGETKSLQGNKFLFSR